MRIKRIIAAFLTGITVAVFTAGCGQNTTEEDNAIHIGVCQLTEHSALDEATRGFVDAVRKEFGREVIVDVQIADGTIAGCRTITEQFVADGVDLIMANATPALQAATESTGTIPIVATSITDYSTALGIRKWSGITGINATGTSDLAPIGEQAEILYEIVPTAEKIGILYCVAESNSVFQAETMATELENRGAECRFYTVKSVDEVESVARKAAAENDVLYMPTDNTLASKADILKTIFVEAGIPVIAGEEGLCKAGVATLSIDYYNIGYNAGLMAADIIVNGSEPGLMEIQYADEFVKKYNPENAALLGLNIPTDYMRIE